MSKPDLAHQLTDRELAVLESRIAAEYKKAADELSSKINAYFEQFEEQDEAQRALTGTIVNGREYTGQDYRQWRLAQIGRGQRFEALRDRLAERMTSANEVAAAYINDATPGLYSLNRNYAAYTIEQQAGVDVSLNLWDEQTVRRLIAERPDLLPCYPPERAVNRGIDLAWGKRQITAQVTSGILQGESIGQLTARLQTNIPNMNRDSAIRAARTAVTGAQNAGRQDSYIRAEEMGISLEKTWIATLDNRTRHNHAVADGQTVEEDKSFTVGGYELMYPGDPRGPGHEIYNCRCTMTAKVKGVDMPPRLTYSEWMEQKRQEAEESDIADSARRAAKSLVTGQKVIGFRQLPKEYQQQFRQALAQAAPEAKALIRKHYRQADYILQEGPRSYYSRSFAKDIITLGAQSSPSTLAHELFHKLDEGHKISRQLAEGLAKDKVVLESASQGKIKDYLLRRYPEAFMVDGIYGASRILESYRGVSDIINGMSLGEIKLGYGHRPEYWKTSGALESESWAQFGRIQFENNPEVLKMMNELFPIFSERAMIALKELI